MILYYRFFHPAGPINPCVGESVDLKFGIDNESFSRQHGISSNEKETNVVRRHEESPDFVIEFEENTCTEKQNSTPPPVPKRKIQHSRSFKNTYPKMNQFLRNCTVSDENSMVFPEKELEHEYSQRHEPLEESPITNKTLVTTDRGGDSAYGTDSNRTASRNNGSPPQAGNLHNIDIHTQNEDHDGTFIQNSSGSSIANHSSGSSSAAFNNETYMSIEKQDDIKYDAGCRCHCNEDPLFDAPEGHNNTYQSVNVQSPAIQACSKSRHGDNNCDKKVNTCTYATPSKLLKRSPIVKDVTIKATSGFAHISPTQKVVQKTNIETNVPRGTSKANHLINNGARLENSAQKRTKEGGLNPPLTIIIPNISHRAFASKTNNEKKYANAKETISKDCSATQHVHARQQSEQFSDKTIPLEVLNPNIEAAGCNIRNNSNLASHDYENLALININRGAIGVKHWKTYSNMADEDHDNSISYDRARKVHLNNTNPSTTSTEQRNADYSSLNYFDIYPLSREMKEQLYRSITPISTAATMASDSQTNVTDSDTYEPIETYAVNIGRNDGSVAEDRACYSACSSTEHKVPVPLTLIHHDGRQVSTRQIVTMESLKELLYKHENVPMDDPQDRGDLYLLAPMRLLTPILEETESEITGGLTAHSHEEDFNRSVMTVISEMLTNHSKNMMLYQSVLSEKQNQKMSKSQDSTLVQHSLDNDSIGPCDAIGSYPDGQFQDSVDSASSTLVQTIEEIRNQSLCNLYFYSSSSLLDGNHLINDAGVINPNNNGAAPQVPSKNHFIPIDKNQMKNMDNLVPKMISKQNNSSTNNVPDKEANANNSFSNSSIKSIESNTLVLTPQKLNCNENHDKQKQKKTQKKKSPLYSSVGTRKNLFQLADKNSMAKILNTPSRGITDKALKCNVSKLNIPSSDHTLKENTRNMDVPEANFLSKVRETPSSDSETDTESNVNHKENANETVQPSTTPVYFGNSFLCENRSILSPSSKYNTPTPPLRPNQFVRNINPTNRTRRKFSVIRETFESPDMKRKASDKPRQMITARSNNDLYENISDDFLMLRNSVREKQERISKCQSVPSFVDKSENGLNLDQKYCQHISSNENILRPTDMMRNQWSTKSYQNFSEGEKYLKNQNPNIIGGRNKNYRRSMSVLDSDEKAGALTGNKENYNPQISYEKFVKTVNNFPPPPLPYKLPPKPQYLRTNVANQSTTRICPSGYTNIETGATFPSPLLSSSPQVRQNSITTSSKACYMINTNRLCNPTRQSTLSPQSNVFNTSKHYRQSRLI